MSLFADDPCLDLYGPDTLNNLETNRLPRRYYSALFISNNKGDALSLTGNKLKIPVP